MAGRGVFGVRGVIRILFSEELMAIGSAEPFLCDIPSVYRNECDPRRASVYFEEKDVLTPKRHVDRTATVIELGCISRIILIYVWYYSP